MDKICRAITNEDGTVTFESATASGSTLEQIIQDDKAYGVMTPKNGKYFTYKAMDWEGKWINHKQIQRALTIVWNITEKVIEIKAVEALPGEYVDFKVYFKATADDPLLTPNTLMYHYYPINDFNNPNRGVCVVNTDFNWDSHGNGIPMHLIDPEHYPEGSTQKAFDYDFDSVYEHEATGHGLGLPHSPNRNTKMWGNYLGMIEYIYDEKPPETIPRLQAKYQVKQMTPEELERWIEYYKVRQDKY